MKISTVCNKISTADNKISKCKPYLEMGSSNSKVARLSEKMWHGSKKGNEPAIVNLHSVGREKLPMLYWNTAFIIKQS